MANKFNKNYSNIEMASGKIVFSKEVEYNDELLELVIEVKPDSYKRINYEYRPIIQEI